MSTLLAMMSDPGRASQWAAIAGIGQILLLAVNAGIVWCYLQETKKIRQAAESQLEDQIRPALVVKIQGGVQIQNIGSGSALDLAVAEVSEEAEKPNWDQIAKISPPETYVRPGEDPTRRAVIPDKSVEKGQALQLLYRSLSGRAYASLVHFDVNGSPVRTQFFDKRRGPPC